MTCNYTIPDVKEHRVRVRVRGPRTKKSSSNKEKKTKKTLKVQAIDVTAPTQCVDADPHPYDDYINKAGGGHDWVLELQRLVEDAENMMNFESNRFEVMTWTPLPWPGVPTDELTTASADAMVMLGVKAHDETFLAYGDDPRVRHLLCDETAVDIELGIRDALRAKEVQQISSMGCMRAA